MSEGEQRRLLLLSSSEPGSVSEIKPQPIRNAPAGNAEENRELLKGGRPRVEQRLSTRSERVAARRAEASQRQDAISDPAVAGELSPASSRLGVGLQSVPETRHIEELLLQLPGQFRKRSYGAIISFFLCVMVPLLVAAVYYVVIASNQYLTEFRFVVREISSTPSLPSATSSVAAMFGTSTSSNPTENYLVAEYLASRQVVDQLQEKIDIRSLYSRPSIDWWSRFDPSQPAEKFVSYWRNMVSASYDQITGIVVVQVRAFTPNDAHLIATTMVSLAESLINDISTRPRMDAVKFAEQEVKRAEDRLRQIRTKIAEYRDKESVIEPNSSVVTSNTTLAQSLRAIMVQYQTELGALTKQNLRPDAPYIQSLRSRINAAREQLAAVEGQVANSREGNQALSRVVGQYEQLDLERQFAQTILTSTVQSLEQARANAITQHLYVSPFVRPARPESATYPNRVVAILTVGLACFFVWTVGLLLVRSIREHLA